MTDIVAMARAAQHDERLSDGALYGKLADEIEQLRKTLRSLANDVRGVFDVFEYGIRQEISNTNFAVVCDKLEEAYRVLGVVPPAERGDAA